VNFNDEAIDDVFSKVVSYAMLTGRFDYVNQHEPVSSPHQGVQCSVWIQRIHPIASSGLSSTSGVVQLSARIYMNFVAEPRDVIDPKITAAICDLMGTLSADFDFGGEAGVRAVDLLGMSGISLEAQAGYLEIDRQMFRVMTLTIPVIIDDMFIQRSSRG